MRSSQNVAIVKIPFRSRAMSFSNNRLLFVSVGKRFAIGNSGAQLVTVVLGIHRHYTMSKRSLMRKYTLITFMVSITKWVLIPNTADGL